jgi:hypothetical protein
MCLDEAGVLQVGLPEVSALQVESGKVHPGIWIAWVDSAEVGGDCLEIAECAVVVVGIDGEEKDLGASEGLAILGSYTLDVEGAVPGIGLVLLDPFDLLVVESAELDLALGGDGVEWVAPPRWRRLGGRGGRCIDGGCRDGLRLIGG